MPASDLVIRGAREHNLRDVDLTLPRNKLIVMTKPFQVPRLLERLREIV